MPRSGRAAVLAVLGLVVVALGATAGPLLSTHPDAGRPSLQPVPRPTRPPSMRTTVVPPHPVAHPPTHASAAHSSFHLPLLVVLVLAALLLVAAAILLWRTTPRTAAPQPESPQPAVETAPTLRAAAAGARAALDDRDPRAAVIRCWLTLEHAAAGSGVERNPSDTPGELAARVLAGHEVDAGALEHLRGLYQGPLLRPSGRRGRPGRGPPRRRAHRRRPRPARARPAADHGGWLTCAGERRAPGAGRGCS